VNGRSNSGGEPPSTGFEVLVVVAAGAFAAVGGITFGGAWVATRPSGHVSGDISVWWSVIGRLAQNPSDPAAGWGDHASGIPGPAWYWSATAIVAAAIVTAALGLLWLWRRSSAPRRERLGVDTDAHLASPREVKTLAVSSTVPPQGRFLLGRMAPRGPLLATEDRDRHALRGKAGRRQGSRGSVALIGPTQAGKTVMLSAGVMGWDGPVVALSVKRDLYDVTASARARAGALAVFDPGESTKLPTARWTPLRGVTTASGALRAGRALAAAIPRSGVTGGDYWAQQGETFVSAYMALAGLSELLPECRGLTDGEPLTIQRLTAWAFRGAGITDPIINELVRAGLQSGHLETQKLAEAATLKLMALHQEDSRIRASIYATARLAFEAWAEPSVEHSASLKARATYHSDELWSHKPRFVDLDWLMGDDDDGKANTLYLIAPDTEFKRLAPVLGGLLGDLREQIHAWDIKGRRLAKPLLFVIDEAAQLELQWLPEEVSTIAGLGGMFITCWQSKAQIDHRYGTLADAVLGGHRSKVVFTGCDDPATLNWLGKVAGTEHVARRSWSADKGGGRRTISENLQREDLVDAHVVRQMWPGEAVLLHGTLPPVHLRSVRWWTDKTLRELVDLDDNGRPVPPDASTCPLSDEEIVPGTDGGLDRSAHDESATHLPPSQRPPGPAQAAASPRRAAPKGSKPSTRKVPARASTSGGEQLALLDPDATEVAPPGAERSNENTTAGACMQCGKWVDVGDGTRLPYQPAVLILCDECQRLADL
jgi:type IV secretion system protein VirD4